MRVLVLGGIRSGKSALAEALVADVERVRYVATARSQGDDDWTKRLAAHRARRPATWSTEEIGDEPDRLAALLTEASDDDVLIVDDLGGWLAAGLDGDVAGAIETLVTAVQDCPAERLVLVAPEVGLSVVPATPAGLAFADASGTLNQRIAAACESVAFVVAGQPTWLRGGPVFPARPEKPFTAEGAAAWTAPIPLGDVPDLQPGLDLPMPDDAASGDAGNRLRTLEFAGAGLGTLASVVLFAAATQARPDPRPWRAPRTLLVRGDHAGGGPARAPPEGPQRGGDGAPDGGGAPARLGARAGRRPQLGGRPRGRRALPRGRPAGGRRRACRRRDARAAGRRGRGRPATRRLPAGGRDRGAGRARRGDRRGGARARLAARPVGRRRGRRPAD